MELFHNADSETLKALDLESPETPMASLNTVKPISDF